MSAAACSMALRLEQRLSAYLAVAFSLLVAAWFAWESRFFFPMPSSQDVGPGGMPVLVAGVIALAACVLARRWRQATAAIAVHEPLRVLATLLLLLGMVLGLNSVLNAWLVVAAFILTLQLTLGERRLLFLLLGTALLTLAVWLVFGWVLGVPL
jgi:hypothetical protein